MDGIGGIVFSDVFQMSNFIEPMLNTMAHRGRAFRDICTLKNVQLGVCGGKFLSNPAQTLFAALDGTLFNTAELQKELSIEDPSQTLIAAYEKWGTDCFSRLKGDFAIALYDQKAETLYLVRDRIGKKPLYWYHDEHHFVFASELKALLATGIVPQTLARDAIASYLYFGYIPQDMSPIKGVNKLLPAHYLELDASGTKHIHPYWSYSSYFKNIRVEPETVVQNLDRLLAASVALNCDIARRRDPSLLGCLVSGGLGSASIAYYMRKSPTVCFSAGFQGENEEDIAAAKEVAQTLSLPHKVAMLKPENCLDPLAKIIWHLDEPLADPNILATWEIFKLSSQQTGSVFSGMGSDELLAGHGRYTLEEQKLSSWQTAKEGVTACSRAMLLPLLKQFWRSAAFSLLKSSSTNPSQFRYLSQNAIFTEEQIATAAPKLKGLFDPEIFLNKFQKLFQFKSNVASYGYFDVKTRLADRYLLQYERLTAAHGLDLYTPFLDQELIEYMAGILEPADLTASGTAAYLKEILSKVYPPSVIDRPKVSRPHFLASWMPQFKEIFKLLLDGALVENGIISRRWLQGALNRPSNFPYLWSILVLEIWYRLFINNPISRTPPELSVKDLLLKRH